MIGSVWFSGTFLITANTPHKHFILGEICAKVFACVFTVYGSQNYTTMFLKVDSDILNCTRITWHLSPRLLSHHRSHFWQNLKSKCPQISANYKRSFSCFLAPLSQPLSDYWVWGELRKQSATNRWGPEKKKIQNTAKNKLKEEFRTTITGHPARPVPRRSRAAVISNRKGY